MKLTRWHHTAVQIALVTSLGTSAFAQATRTWISGGGDDANPCSRTAPCKTLAGAISKTAASGEINSIDPGGFGAVTITKSMTINLTPSLGGILVSGTNGIVISNTTGGAMNVTLRGLDINGLGTGLSGVNIIGNSPTTVHIEASQIYGFNQNGINIVPAPGGSANVTIAHTRISECVGSIPGINADATNGAVNVTVINSEVHNCGTGLNLLAGAKAEVRLSDFSQNTTGVSADASTAMLDSGTIGFCTTAVSSLTAGTTIRLTNMTIVDNTTGLSAPAGAIVSFGNNRMKGNVTNGAPSSTVFPN